MENKITENARFHERFEYFIKTNSVKQRDIAKFVDVTESAVNKWKNGSRFPKDDMRLIKLAEILRVNIIDILPYSNKNRKLITIDELKNNIENYLKYIPNSLPSSIKQIDVTKGYPSSANKILQEDSMHYATQIYIDKRMVKTSYQDKELKAVVMIGDSMSPYLENDDIAIYYPTTQPIGDGRYVLNTPHGLTVKKLKFMTNGTVRLISENPDYNTLGTYDEEFTSDTLDTLEIFGLVVGRILKS